MSSSSHHHHHHHHHHHNDKTNENHTSPTDATSPSVPTHLEIDGLKVKENVNTSILEIEQQQNKSTSTCIPIAPLPSSSFPLTNEQCITSNIEPTPSICTPATIIPSQTEKQPILSKLKASAAPRSLDSKLLPTSSGIRKKRTTRCNSCRKKIGITNSFKCKCDHLFCGACRYPEGHKCSFDFKSEAKKKLALNNPKVEAAKLNKI
jgi:hypothetical protein